MGFSHSDSHVRADLFTESGKWAYTVVLDYSGMGRDGYEHWNMQEQARQALARATEAGISGVILRQIPPGWRMVVLEPMSKYSYPIIVQAKNDDEEIAA